MEYTPAQEIKSRVERLQREMVAEDIEAALIVQNVDLFYLSGSCQSGHLIVPSAGEPCYMVRKNYARAQIESPLEDIRPQESTRELPDRVRELAPRAGRVGLELDVLPARLFLRYRKMFPEVEFVDISPLLRKIRARKSDYEIALLRKGAEISRRMFAAVPDCLEEGKTEIQLAGELECIMRTRGHQGAVRMRGFNQELFYGHLLAGENLTRFSHLDSPTGGEGVSPAFPQGAGWKKIGRHEPLMIDYVAVFGGYIVDSARLFCLGKLPASLTKAYAAALAIQEELCAAARPGVPCSEIYALAGKLAAKFGLEENFMGCGGDRVPFIGHGVGLELDELPVLADRIDSPLEENMVLALEPKMFFPGMGAAGIENTFVVRQEGLEKITAYPEEIVYLS